VTGGASGLGAATVRSLLSAGASAVILDLPSSPGRALADEFGDRVDFVAGDVTTAEDVARACKLAQRRGPLAVAVATAGISAAAKLTESTSPTKRQANFNRIIQVNLVGTFNLLSCAAETMKHSKVDDGERGVIVCTASIAAFDGQIGQVAYAASKSGVAGMTLPAARELARHAIRVVTVAPGLFDTPMFAGVPDNVRESVGAQVPHPSRLGRPDEYA